MTKLHRGMWTALGACVLAAFLSLSGTTANAQAAKTLLDPNKASEAEMLKLPHMTPAIAKGLIEKRPFTSVIALNKYLLDQKLTPEQVKEVFAGAFVPVSLNTGTRDEYLLIPGVGARMVREFNEYRPWKNMAQFDKEIGKYVGQEETDRLKAYIFIPAN